jgi:hypothetical protein
MKYRLTLTVQLEEDDFDELESDFEDEDDILDGDEAAMMRRVADAESDDEAEEGGVEAPEESDLYASAEDYSHLLDKTLTDGEFKQVRYILLCLVPYICVAQLGIEESSVQQQTKELWRSSQVFQTIKEKINAFGVNAVP